MSQQNYWGDKPYYSLNYYLKQTFGEKIYKLSLDGGMTCPNRDGKLGTGGCIFCSSGGSGDFATPKQPSITNQIDEAIKHMNSSKIHKQVGTKYIAYFQSFTNTYAPIEYLRKIFYEAIHHPNIVALSIATRPDCLDLPVLDLLEELNTIKPVWVELGLQTMHEHTAQFIRRKYSLHCFEQAVNKLATRHLSIIVHIILGLPFETTSDMVNTVKYLSTLPISGVKLQLLHVLKNTDLCNYLGQFHILTMDEYISILIKCIELIPPHIVIHRITGDGPKNLLLAPQWSTNKKVVLNQIHKTMRENSSWQGKYYKEV